MKFSSEVVHFSSKTSKNVRSKVTPIYQTSAFTFSNLQQLEDFYNGSNDYLYSRVSNPNTDELGKAVAILEGAEDGVATSSGMSAILAAILSVVSHGDHIIAADDVYGGTYHLLAHELAQMGIEATFVSFKHTANIVAAIKQNTKLIYTESISNPLLRVEDLYEIVAVAKEHELVTIIDNTFATPYLLNPIKSGFDLVVHSATKYLGGHSDITAGVVVGPKLLIEKAKSKVVNLGANLSPFEAWLTSRGIKTLAVRMERQVENAARLAEALQTQSDIKHVYYPKQASSKGNGAIVTIELNETICVDTFFINLNWVKIVPTLAGVETTVSYPIATSHRALPEEAAAELGITKGVVRISVGIEDAEDIIAVFKNAIMTAKM
ncbi:PLP-dependent transferase [Bacillus sp. HMF5848]|uniref:trans-sulfuration enzyme family protein n=1 Tax=Bacillus sp. HMF5848 TaxID=2495421 RepID=UPI000F7B2668|nr:PLP-dependent aspartate aminotransferase family protein [Bacillus sp. HMF5848]RSK27158.1 PLP-dependent transferase [Bacillus sp. HMF5848]